MLLKRKRGQVDGQTEIQMNFGEKERSLKEIFINCARLYVS